MSSDQLDIWQDPAKEIGEVLIDEALDDLSPALAKVPLLSTLMAAVKSGKAWSDYLLARKVQNFYSAWEILEAEERKTIYEKFQKRPRAFIEKLLFILEKQEDTAKCRMLGVLAIQYLKGDIRRADYYDLIETVSQLSASDLASLGELITHASIILPQRIIGERYTTLFLSRGLIASAPKNSAEQRVGRQPDYRLTMLGEKLGKVVSLS